MNTSQSWKILPNCRRKKNTNKKKKIVRKLIKKSKMQHYHEALNNARKNPKDTWNLLRQLVPGKSKQTKCNFQNSTISASTFNNFFATAEEKTYNNVTQRRQTKGFDVQARHERTHSRITRKSSLWSPQPVETADVILAMSKLKNTKSTGHDQINLHNISEKV